VGDGMNSRERVLAAIERMCDFIYEHHRRMFEASDGLIDVAQVTDDLAGDGTGYILAPCHNIQAVSPLDNILAMYDEAWRYGKR